MSVSPQILTNIDPNATWDYLEYRWRETSGNYERYSVYDSSGNFNSTNDIRVDTTTNTWQDQGSDHPYTVTEQANGTVVLSGPGYPNLYTFTKPTTASWISSGGGGDTGLEEVPSTPSGSLTYRNGSVYYLIHPDSPTTSTTDKYGIMEDGNFLGFSSNTIPHTQGQYTSGSVSGSVGSLYSLKYTNTLGSTSIIDLATITASKGSKVFCNFW